MKLILILVPVLLLLVVVAAGDAGDCEPWSCGDLHNISYPFSLKGDPRNNCGPPEYELACENNRAILYLYHGSYYVLSINYLDLTMRVVDTGLQLHNCSSLPRHSLTLYNFTNRQDPYQLDYRYIEQPFVFLNCGFNGVVDTSQYVDMSPCINTSSSSPKNLRNYSSSNYYVVWRAYRGDIKEGCTIELVYSAFISDSTNITTYYDIHRQMLKGVALSWSNLLCVPCFHRGYEGCAIHQLNGLSSPFNCYDRRSSCGMLRPIPYWLAKVYDILGITYLYPERMDKYKRAALSIEITGTVLLFLLPGRTACGILWVRDTPPKADSDAGRRCDGQRPSERESGERRGGEHRTKRGVDLAPLRSHFFLHGGRPERQRPPGQSPEIPLRRVEATEGGGGRGRGGELVLPSTAVDGGKMNFPPPL
ncbi:hypothetical protein Sjap_021097 [Stephania japonica]|uniref:Wall-associated receptor kinase galacturonan-binding domain-containing protein n=1 Tax=Stephania japonica TaxID=461633 RepID=A0AAP0HW57_9MAGN